MAYVVTAFMLVYGASTTTKIKDSEKNLNAAVSAKKQASRQLEKIAQDIKKAEQESLYLGKKIEELGQEKETTQKEYQSLKTVLSTSEQSFRKTSSELEEKHKAFIALLSEQFSVIFAMRQFHTPTEHSVIAYEVYEVYKKHNAKELEKLRADISTLKTKKQNILMEQNKTKKELEKIVQKRQEFAQKKLAKKRLLEKLSKDEKNYNKQLEQIEEKQSSLRATLAKLNILHDQEVEEARKRAAARKEAIRLETLRKKRLREQQAAKGSRTRQTNQKIDDIKSQKETQSTQVRNLNASYRASSVYAYSGEKTISPLSGARVVKEFGTYVDPIYKIKIFNESVTLQSPSSDAKVQNVLNGKVVFAGESSMLGKVVVVAHGDKMHTVYAGLSKIAPNITVGRKIIKGYVLGKVNSKLVFQATKNSKHIDPLKLIQI
ncbi:MAG: hypothetical protein QG564_541 [Campylobacterota bacterium]|nr:hypothetical protein [Campylobacterota bacterium]